MNSFDNKLKKIGVGLGAMALLFAVGSLVPGNTKAAPPPSSTPVTVVNTNPIPVSVSGTPSVNVGSPTVSISGTPTVSVTNAASAAVYTRGADNPAQQPWQWGFDPTDTNPAFYSVPNGKRLVIEFTSAELAEAACPSYVELSTTAGGNQLYWYLLTGGPGASPRTNMPTRIYADANTNVEVLVSTVNCSGGNVGMNQADVEMSGYLVNVP